jgi:hypothetical protein
MDLALQSISSIFPHVITGQKTFLKSRIPVATALTSTTAPNAAIIQQLPYSSYSPILLVFFFIHALMMLGTGLLSNQR